MKKLRLLYESIGFRDVLMESVGGGVGVTPLILSNVQESWLKLSHVAGELATVFCVTFIFLVK